MRTGLPIGVPKLCVSTMVAGDVGQYVGESDIGLVPAIVDFPGRMNGLSEVVLRNAAAAVSGMARAYWEAQKTSGSESEAAEGARGGKKKKRIALSMFGVTTPAVTRACELLGEEYETVVFHCTGAGGKSMERLIQEKVCVFHACNWRSVGRADTEAVVRRRAGHHDDRAGG
jgi:uncharacterized protein (UPF0261 family)